jgi:hypothetical protein
MDLRSVSIFQRSFLKSSTLASVLYFPAHRELEVAFRSGEIYRYLDVPTEAYSELLAAPSKGICFNSNIRTRFAFRLLNRFPAAQAGAV